MIPKVNKIVIGVFLGIAALIGLIYVFYYGLVIVIAPMGG